MRDAVKRIARLPVSKLVPDPANPRIMSGENMQRLAASLDKFGLVDPLVVAEREDGTFKLLSGHQRHKVLCQSGVEEAWCAVVELSPEEERALNVTLNSQNLAGEYDLPALSEIMKDLPKELAEVAGFSEEEMAAIGAAGSDDAEPPPEFPRYDEDVETKYRCPKCSYEWSGQPRPGGE